MPYIEENCKEARPKGKSTDGKTKHRPLCILNVMETMLEHMMVVRMMAEVETKGGIVKNQYG